MSSRSAANSAAADASSPDPLGILEAIQSGDRPSYCLSVGPAEALSTGPNMQRMFAQAFSPLPVVALEGDSSLLRRLPTEGRLAEEAFATLAEQARVLLVIPTERPQVVEQLRWLREHHHLWRCIFHMPDVGVGGITHWQAPWHAAQNAIAPIGLELPPYTTGGWLFRYDTADVPPRSCTFRMIAHPTPDKIAIALEAICGEMSEP